MTTVTPGQLLGKTGRIQSTTVKARVATWQQSQAWKFLMQKVNKETAEYRTWFWIGGSEKEREGIWEWEDGSEWEFTKWANESTQQPNNHEKDPVCLQIYGGTSASNGWNDKKCKNHYQFICSWKFCSGCDKTFIKRLLCKLYCKYTVNFKTEYLNHNPFSRRCRAR